MACTRCHKDWFNCGVTQLQVEGILEAETDYVAILTTPQGYTYRIPVATDAQGNFFLDPTDNPPFPPGLFNPYAGLFLLQVESDTCEPATWNDSAYCTPYDCIEFEVRPGSDDNLKDYIGCDCP